MALRVLLVSLCCLGVLAEDKSSAELRLVGGASRCEGTVEVEHRGQWRRVTTSDPQDLEAAAAVCRDLDCGSALSGENRGGFPQSPLWEISPDCVKKKSAVKECVRRGVFSSVWGLNVKCSELRLVGGASRCEGTVEVEHRGEWRRVTTSDPQDLEAAAAVCRDLDCGSALSRENRDGFPQSPLWKISPDCVKKSAVKECVRSEGSSSVWGLNVKCSELRLVGGASRCEGTVEVEQEGEWRRVRTSDPQDLEAAAAVCRDLDCGSALSGENRDDFPQSPLWKISPDCVKKKSAVKECVRSEGSSTVWGLNVKCSELRLVGGASRCEGTVEVEHRGQWRRVRSSDSWDLEAAAAVCRDLDCGSAVSREHRDGFPQSPLWEISPDCVKKKSAVKECVRSEGSSSVWGLNVKCSELRLVGGASRCEGTVEMEHRGEWRRVRTSEPWGPWDLEAAAAVCRDLDCGSALSGEHRDDFPQSPLWEILPDCVKKKSAVKECVRGPSSSVWGLNVKCSELRLVGGASRCEGTVEVEHRGEWRRVRSSNPWDLEAAAAVCRDLDCGSAVSGENRGGFPQSPLWEISPDCVKKKSAVKECVRSEGSSSVWGLNVKCSEFRLVGGASRCEGTVEVKHEGEWRRVTTSDPQDLEATAAVCRDLDCGSALSGENRDGFPQSPLWKISLDCVKKKSAVKECVRSEGSSSVWGLNVKCSELRLVGGASRCEGTVEVEHEGEWRRVRTSDSWDLEAAAAVCRDLDCGSALSGEHRDGFPQSPSWEISPDCVKKKSAVKECVRSEGSSSVEGLNVKCSDFLHRPIISLSVIDGVSDAQPQGVRVQQGSKFRVKCSVEPQFPGGSFQLLSPTVDPTQSHTLPAVNHSAHFLFSDAGPAHTGNYTYVYHLQVFDHAFSSQSPALKLSLGDLNSNLIIRVLVILLLMLMCILPLFYYYYYKVRARGGTRERPQL